MVATLLEDHRCVDALDDDGVRSIAMRVTVTMELMEQASANTDAEVQVQVLMACRLNRCGAEACATLFNNGLFDQGSCLRAGKRTTAEVHPQAASQFSS